MSIDIPADIVAAVDRVFAETHNEFQSRFPYRGEPDVFDFMARAMLAERNRVATAVSDAWESDTHYPEIAAIIENRS